MRSAAPNAPKSDDKAALLEWLQEGVIGAGATIRTLDGVQPVRYFDYVASSRAFGPIEELLLRDVLPYIANTHTESSGLGRLINRLYDRAHETVARCVGANEDDVVIFTGSGCTGAINHLIFAMGLRLPENLKGRVDLRREDRPVIFTSLMEHHSNDLAWRETIGDVVHIGLDREGQIDLAQLDRKLKDYPGRPRIGSFTMASNVTGILTDHAAIARMLHAHGAHAFFDAAAAAPYVEINMHPGGAGADMDAVFISPHKFLGGPQTPGLLVAKKSLFTNFVPVQPGGGTVLWVDKSDRQYLDDVQRREESGTPPIVQVIRAALAFELKEIMGTAWIDRRERSFVRRAMDAWRGNPNLILLGNPKLPRLGIVSVIFTGLHHNLAVRLLSDRYGIQARGGCMCAGPYGHYLLGIDETTSARIRSQLDAGHIGEKPGWVRFGFSPVTTEEDFAVLLEAVDHIGAHGAEYAGLYRLDDATGEYGALSEPGELPELRLETFCAGGSRSHP